MLDEGHRNMFTLGKFLSQPDRRRELASYTQDLFANSRIETQIHFDCFITGDSLRLGAVYSGRFDDDS